MLGKTNNMDSNIKHTAIPITNMLERTLGKPTFSKLSTKGSKRYARIIAKIKGDRTLEKDQVITSNKVNEMLIQTSGLGNLETKIIYSQH